jgi:hypothetical protein
LTADGSVLNSQSGFREIIQNSGAAIVIVASQNPAEHYIATGKPTAYATANLAMTMDRRGEAFPTFYKRLFDLMSQGVSMPVAWVKIAPQVPGSEHDDCPGAICRMERGQVTFGSPIGFAA